MYLLLSNVKNSMILHARGSSPNECCGLVGGKDNLFTTYYPLANCAKEPTKNYFADPKELLLALKKISLDKQDLLGIYHSHIQSIAYPSSKDIESAIYPNAVYFIISLEQENLAAFEIKSKNVINVDFSVID